MINNRLMALSTVTVFMLSVAPTPPPTPLVIVRRPSDDDNYPSSIVDMESFVCHRKHPLDSQGLPLMICQSRIFLIICCALTCTPRSDPPLSSSTSSHSIASVFSDKRQIRGIPSGPLQRMCFALRSCSTSTRLSTKMLSPLRHVDPASNAVSSTNNILPYDIHGGGTSFVVWIPCTQAAMSDNLHTILLCCWTLRKPGPVLTVAYVELATM
ncbi:hypothetical protein DEU56DRAFT_842068 [Suillus clintonianus]|uniref:uncharacterized protein n=1 Tax=Suillus clintonianus TaxID=1904413 RepID=UPI001B862105|nr:uncharacterized protein DEU56DRAFT_842068 [Suillus clintonianus]KAG2113960.1 hypothetical protein DEU56DRAFT_842068 [Suillus clintonianus]